MRRSALVLALLLVGCRDKPKPAPVVVAAPPSVTAEPTPSPSAGWKEDELLQKSLEKLAAVDPSKVPEVVAPDVAPSQLPGLAALVDAPDASVEMPESMKKFYAALPAHDVDGALAAIREGARAKVAVKHLAGAMILLVGELSELSRSGRDRQADAVVDEVLSLTHPDREFVYAQAVMLGTYGMSRLDARQPLQAKRWADRAIAIDESFAGGWVVKARAAYDNGDLDDAVSLAERGLTFAPGNPALTALRDRYRREAENEAGSHRRRSRHFVLSIDGAERDESADATMTTLEEAFSAIAKPVYGFEPETRISVVLYPNKVFQAVKHVGWASAFYDGRVRMPTGGSQSQTILFRQTAYHEVGHAIFASAVGDAISTTPTWLNEGLSERAEMTLGGQGSIDCVRGHIGRLSDIERGFAHLTHAQALAAYWMAHHAVDRLFEKYGADRVAKLLFEARRRGDVRSAFEPALGVSYERFVSEFDAEQR